MFIKAIFLSLTLVSVYAAGGESCPSAKVAGFCLRDEKSTAASDVSDLKKKLEYFSEKFPVLISTIQKNGYGEIAIRSSQSGETGGTVLAELVKEQKLIILYKDFFSAARETPALQNLGYSVADIALLHELIHAFDEDDELVRHNLNFFGWNHAANVAADGFRIPMLADFANSWVTSEEISAVKNDLAPLLADLGPWEIYLRARERLKKSGYPTIYSVLGGPVESFAELGAYIALDPSAASYIPAETIQWFRDAVLK
jgi:hypothetical protein